MKIHHVKIEHKFFIRLVSKQKSFEIRYNDRDYQVGDKLEFTIINWDKNDPSIYYNHTYEITYIHQGFGMQDGYVVLGVVCLTKE